MLKKISWFLSLFTVIVVFTINTEAISAVIVSINNQTTENGATIEIPININQANGIAGFQFTITYDSNVLKAIGASAGSLDNGWTIMANTNTPGQIKVGGFSANPLPSGSGSIVELKFNVVGDIGASTQVNITYSKIVDSDGNEIPSQTQGGVLSVGNTSSTFSDLYPTDWFYTYVEDIAKAGITTGYPDGTYRPFDLVTRAQMAAFLARALKLGVPSKCNDYPFYDVDTNAWYCKYVEAIKSAGITSGYSDGSYKPNDYVTRAQMAAFIAKALHLNIQPCTSQPFSDVPTDAWYCPYVQAIKNAGITSGYPDGTYRPDVVVTRAIMAAFIDKAFLKNNDNSREYRTFQ